MTLGSGLNILTAAMGVLTLTALFSLYQNPLLEIYLAEWGIWQGASRLGVAPSV
jgi:hypothetical protein